MASVQKVRAVLKKSGLSPARSWQSGMIKGYTCWSDGYRAIERDGVVIAFWQQDFYRQEKAQKYAERIHAILRAVGIVCFINQHYEVVIAPSPPPPTPQPVDEDQLPLF
jgi:hypothetical protein